MNCIWAPTENTLSDDGGQASMYLQRCMVLMLGGRLACTCVVAWRSGSVVGLDLRSKPTLSPVSTGMGDHLGWTPGAAFYFGM